MSLTEQLGMELPSASAAQIHGDSDRMASGGLVGLQDLLPSHGFLRMLLRLTLPILHSIHVEDKDCNL